MPEGSRKMKKSVMMLGLISIVILVMPAIPITCPYRSLSNDQVIKAVRSQHMNDFRSKRSAVISEGPYHTYEEMMVLLDNLAGNHSDIMSVASIGKTYEGRDLWMVKLSDNVSREEEEPGVLFMGAHHGNEKPSYEVCLYFIEYMVEHYEDNNLSDVRDAIDNTQIYILPMVNPDGVEAGTRKNRIPNYGSFGYKKDITSIGVDLNRNYGYRWMRFFLLLPFYLGSTSYLDESIVYRGKYPFSENETQAIQGFIDTHSITISISYHTYGKLVLYPWGYSFMAPKDKPLFVSLCENISTLNHYTSCQSIRLYPTIGDACDWMYGTYGIYALTIELGDSPAPLEPEVVEEMCLVHTKVNLYVCDRAQFL